jgi:SAM-dependent methyltransferase
VDRGAEGQCLTVADERTSLTGPDRGESRSAEQLNARHRETYNLVTARYAEVNADLPPMVAAAAERFLAELVAGARVLDLGCGHGRDMAWFEAAGVRVTGADLARGMLFQARIRVAGPLVELDMRSPAFRERCFDGVWCNAAILHLPVCEVPETLVRIRHILKHAGICFYSVQIGSGEDWEPQSYGEPAPRFFTRYRPGDFGSLLCGAGFAIVAYEESPESSPRQWAHYLARRVD